MKHWALRFQGDFGRDPRREADACVFDIEITCERCGERIVWPRLPFRDDTRAELVRLVVDHLRCAPRTEPCPPPSDAAPEARARSGLILVNGEPCWPPSDEAPPTLPGA